MATADEYAQWIVKNADKKGTAEFDIVARAYQDARSQQLEQPVDKPADAPIDMTGKSNAPQQAKAGEDVINAVKYGAGTIGRTLIGWTDKERRAQFDKNEAEVAKNAGPLYGPVKFATEVAATAPVGPLLGGAVKATGAAPALAEALSSAGMAKTALAGAGFKATLADLATRSLAGGAVGAASAGLVDPEHAKTGAVIGMVAPGIFSFGGMLFNAAGNLIGPQTQKTIDFVKGKTLAEVAGKDADNVLAAVDKAKLMESYGGQKGMNFGQAAASSGSAPTVALQDLVKPHNSSVYLERDLKEEASRAARLTKVAQGDIPEMAVPSGSTASSVAKDIRSANAAENYGKAYGKIFNADPELAQIAQNPYFEKALPTAIDLAKANKIDFKSDPTQFLHYVKIGIDKQIDKVGETALAGTEKKAATEVKEQLLNWLAKKNPEYDAARAAFAKESPPITGMEIGEKLQTALQSPVGKAERGNVFATAKNAAEKDYGNLSEIYGKDNAKAVDSVLSELVKEGNYDRLASAGKQQAREIVGSGLNDKTSIPNLLKAPVTLFHFIADKLKGKASEKVIQQLSEDMADPQKAAALMRNYMAQKAKPESTTLQQLMVRGAYQLPNQASQ